MRTSSDTTNGSSNKRFIDAFEKLVRVFKNTSESLASFGSSKLSDRDYILNNLLKDGSTHIVGVDTFNLQQSETYFVSAMALTSSLNTTNGLILRVACLQSGCILPTFKSFVNNVCRAKATKTFCDNVEEEYKDKKASMHLLNFTVVNFGNKEFPRTTYVLSIPNSHIIVKLQTIKIANFSILGDDAVIPALLEENILHTDSNHHILIRWNADFFRTRSYGKQKV